MKFRGDFLGQPSGSVGGITFSHNKGGYYIRKRNIPTNPNSARQQAVRANLGTLAAMWASLTQAQQDAWNLYAANVPMLDQYGEGRTLTGMQHFIRSNTVALLAGAAIIESGPTTFDTGTFTPFGFVDIDVTLQELHYTLTDTDDWANETGAVAVISVGRPQGAGRSFFKGPYRSTEFLEGSSVTPPTSPNVCGLPYVFAAGNKGWASVRILRADGRLSLTQTVGPIVARAVP